MFALEVDTGNQYAAQDNGDVQDPVGNLHRLEQVGQHNGQDDGEEADLQVLGAQLGVHSAEYRRKDIFETGFNKRRQLVDQFAACYRKECNDADRSKGGSRNTHGGHYVAFRGARFVTRNLLGHGDGRAADIRAVTGNPADIGAADAHKAEECGRLDKPGYAKGEGRNRPQFDQVTERRHYPIGDIEIYRRYKVGNDGCRYRNDTDFNTFLSVSFSISHDSHSFPLTKHRNGHIHAR